MLSHLGIKTFVGGNLGNPLSEAAFQCLQNPSLKPKFKVSDCLVAFSSTAILFIIFSFLFDMN